MQQLLAMSLIFEADGLARLGRREEMETRLQQAFALRGDDPEVCAMAWAHVRARNSLIQRRGMLEMFFRASVRKHREDANERGAERDHG